MITRLYNIYNGETNGAKLALSHSDDIFMLACTLFNEEDKGSNLLSIIT